MGTETVDADWSGAETRRPSAQRDHPVKLSATHAADGVLSG